MSPAPSQPLCLAASRPLAGRVTVPGDKSISHRSLMLSALAVGESRVEGLLEGEDVLATARAMRAMGATIERGADGAWTIYGVGVGGLLQPRAALDMGNSGTSARLLMGLVASHAVTATFIGDESLSKRPMGRVIEPLSRMGAEFTASPGGRLPLMVRGLVPAVPIEYRLPVSSAQVKSAVLLAGLNAPGITRVIEPVPTRDHSERMLRGFGAELNVEEIGGERIISIVGEAELKPQRIVVPGDPSSAAFPVVAALIVPGSEIVIENVGLNPTRAGLYEVLRAMGAGIAFQDERTVGGEPVANLRIRASMLSGIEVDPSIVPSMVDEFPILFVACALAEGRSILRGLEELRVKESDRIAVMAEGLRAIGAMIEEVEDGLIIDGTGGEPLAGGTGVATHLDHRIAMSFAVASLACRRPVTVADRTPIATSFPSFVTMMESLGAEQREKPGGMIIAVDGPAASGKGTIAKALAEHYGLPHLDTGLLYRAVGMAVLRGGGDPSDENEALRACSFDEVLLSDSGLKSEAAGRAASIVSAHPSVRAALLERQRDFACQAGGAVLDGRDIGTVIAPEAQAKLFVTAAPQVRAQRRFDELMRMGLVITYPHVLSDIEARDKRDAGRDVAPLRQADDAMLLDTSALGIDAAVATAIELVERCRTA